METRPGAPGGLRLVEEFLRTRNSVTDPAELADWLTDHDLPGSPDGFAGGFSDGFAGGFSNGFVGGFSDGFSDGFSGAIRLREALRALAAANNGLPPDPAALAHVNGEIARLGIRPSLGPAPGRLRVEWPVSGFPGVLLAAVLDAVADGTWTRFKACAADDCRYAFYDHTKNRSARWCDVAGCGVNARMREYRRRKARS
jgi:hypothetical protein